jgi:hypothetical protein
MDHLRLSLVRAVQLADVRRQMRTKESTDFKVPSTSLPISWMHGLAG